MLSLSSIFGSALLIHAILLLSIKCHGAFVDDSMPYGVVNFETSCDPSISDDFNTAVSMLYSFWYSESLLKFDDLIARDKLCCMAYWGAAMTFNHPVWDYITDDRLAAAGNYSNQATQCTADAGARITAREKAYIDSLAQYVNSSDAALNDPATRLQLYADSFNEKVYIPYGTADENAGIVYGLALIGVGYYSETEPSEGFPNLMRAGLVEEIVLLSNAHSPGGLHYVIHSYDQPGIAHRAVDAAYAYLNASVGVPHALHMPSHIFSDMGYWSDMIHSNVLSLDSAFSQAGAPTGDWYHGSFFMQFGELQMAMDCDSEYLMTAMQQFAVDYAEGFNAEAAVRVPTMYLVETRSWEDAASFDLTTWYPSTPPSMWTDNPWTLITSNFVVTAARAILNRPAADITAARQAVDDANAMLMSDPDWQRHQLPYWRFSFDVMVDSAKAWELFRTESPDAGIVAMQEVVAFQVGTWAPEIAHAWDAREQLGEMLLLRNAEGDIEQALAVYEAALETYPNRYNSLAGAAKCAAELDDATKASYYYSELLMVTSAPFPDITMSGLAPSSCPTYAPGRRPDMIDAENYLSGAGSDSSGKKSNDDDDAEDYVAGLPLWLVVTAIVACSVGIVLGISGCMAYRMYSKLAYTSAGEDEDDKNSESYHALITEGSAETEAAQDFTVAESMEP